MSKDFFKLPRSITKAHFKQRSSTREGIDKSVCCNQENLLKAKEAKIGISRRISQEIVEPVCVCGAGVGERAVLLGIRCCWSRDVAEKGEKASSIKSLIYHDTALKLYSVSPGERF